MNKRYQDIIISLENKEVDFKSLVWEVFSYQKKYNPIYKEYLRLINREPDYESVKTIPFCPISVFKNLEVKSSNWTTEAIFKSSGTMGHRSSHYIKHISFYHNNALHIFEKAYGEVHDIEIIGLLPNYHENPNSSLLSMVEYLKTQSKYPGAYYLDDNQALYEHLESNQEVRRKSVVFGVSFALLNYSDLYSHFDLTDVHIIETGGMKRYRKELTRMEIHDKLANCFRGASISSEYGMTECLSQIYAVGSEKFMMNDRMKIVITDTTDPFSVLQNGYKGRVNIIDLANIDTLSFIATDDIGVRYDDESIQILGRMSNSDLRGCNYLI